MKDSINKACKNLPDDYMIHLSMENGAAWVTLEYPDGDLKHIDSDSLEDSINEAILIAVQYQSEIKGWR